MITVRIWLRDGKLKGHKIGKAWRIYKSDLEAFINRS
ncbi:MAG: helix-turn-helix domain-containing protein [Armatimonadetes bacterium]|nr:helix-turn-helix domain-containing protein [Armatimonadota bacterium]